MIRVVPPATGSIVDVLSEPDNDIAPMQKSQKRSPAMHRLVYALPLRGSDLNLHWWNKVRSPAPHDFKWCSAAGWLLSAAWVAAFVGVGGHRGCKRNQCHGRCWSGGRPTCAPIRVGMLPWRSTEPKTDMNPRAPETKNVTTETQTVILCWEDRTNGRDQTRS